MSLWAPGAAAGPGSVKGVAWGESPPDRALIKLREPELYRSPAAFNSSILSGMVNPRTVEASMSQGKS